MNKPVDQLRYRDEDRRLLSLTELSRRARISHAFLRLCLDCGCPTSAGLLSQAVLLDWLFENYADVRAAAGLREAAALDGLSSELQARMRMANAILTLLEYGESRSSNLVEKQQLSWIRRTIEVSLDRA